MVRHPRETGIGTHRTRRSASGPITDLTRLGPPQCRVNSILPAVRGLKWNDLVIEFTNQVDGSLQIFQNDDTAP